jgi:type I restriction enzyme R subunit
VTERKNLVPCKQFREALEDAMVGYTNKQVTTAARITKLLDLARWVREAQKHGQELGLTDEETAFYDALAENGYPLTPTFSPYQVGRGRLLLAEEVKRLPKLERTRRESVRAVRWAVPSLTRRVDAA